ncbi:MAG: protein-disulfide reductase DsbD family protein [Syntrophobacteraceae bacterium]
MKRQVEIIIFWVVLSGLLISQALGAASAEQAGSGMGMFWTVIGIFLGGMTLNLTPCVYPLIPVTISYFGAKSIESKDARGSSVVLHALLYVLGLSLMNSMLGVIAALSGQFLGAVLQNPATLIAVALILVLFGLSMFGLWEFRLPASITGAAARNYAGYFGSLFMGLTLGIVAAPCIGPFVVGVLVWVAGTGDPFFGFMIFFSLSLGMGLPLFVLALLSERLTKLPKSGEWMLWVRKLMGWVLFGMAVYFIRPLFPEILGTGMMAAVAIGAGIHLGWIDSSSAPSAAFKWIRRTTGVLAIGLAGMLIWTGGAQGEGVKWTPYSDTAFAEARNSGKPIIIDFYADWCAPCRQMDKLTFQHPSVIEAAAKDFIMIRVDLTQKGDPQKESLAHRFNLRGVPTVVFLKPGGEEIAELRVMEAMPPGRFLERMKNLKKSSSG